MEKSFVVYYIVYILLFTYLPKSVQTLGFLAFIFISAFYVLYKKTIIHKYFTYYYDLREFRLYFIWFFSIAGFYFIISLLNLPRMWGIAGLGFNISYLPRHFFIIAELLIPVLLSYGIYRLRLYDYFNNRKLILFYIIVFLLNHEICVMGLLLITLSLIAWKRRSKLLMLLAIFINTEQSAYILGFMIMMFLLFFERRITSFLFKNTARKIILILSLSVIILFVSSAFIMYYVQGDPNSLWRLYVWINEINSLSQTYYTGVGFGSAYVTEDIIYQVDNSNMYIQNENGAVETGVFLVANHSSLLNMFYRMGLLGGFLFLTLNVKMICIVIKMYRYADKRMRSLLWRLFSVFLYETVIISLNPGLEMMQFALSYLLCVSFLLAVIYEIQAQLSYNQSIVPKR